MKSALAVTTLNSPAVFEVVNGVTYIGGPTFSGLSSGSREFLEIAWHFSKVAGAYNQVPFISVIHQRDGGSFMTGWEPGTVTSADWRGATWTINFYVDDNATSSVEYKAPLFSARNDAQWLG